MSSVSHVGQRKRAMTSQTEACL